MKENNIYGTIVSLYLAKYNKQAVKNLGYMTFSEAFNDISEKLGLKGKYLKLSRDEFDPFYEWRKGFWKRNVAKRCILTFERFDNLSEESFRSIVLDLINNNKNEVVNSEFVSQYYNDTQTKPLLYSRRGITGENAEKYFIDKYLSIDTFSNYTLSDCRKNGCGYDFEICNNSSVVYYVEVKAITNKNQGLLLQTKSGKRQVYIMSAMFYV